MTFVSGLRTVLKGCDFRRLYVTRVSSQFADGAFQVALTSVFFFSPERQTSAAKIAAAFAVLLLPYSIVGPFAGVLLDRWRRRQVLVYANVVRTAIVLAVAALVATHGTGPALYAVVLVSVSINRFFLAGLSAALPHVVERRVLVTANSVSTTSGTVAALLGAGAGFLLRPVLGAGDTADARLLLLTAVAYLASATLAARMDRDLLGPDLRDPKPRSVEALRGVAVGMVDGARHVWARRPARHALAAITGHRFYYGISTIAAILLYRNYFNAPDDVAAGLAGLAAVFATSGLGFFVAALVTPAATARIGTVRWIVVCFAIAAVTEAVYVVHLSEIAVVLGAFVVGFAAQGSKICVDTILQETVDDEFRGRVFSFYDVVFNVAFVSAAAFAALAVPPTGASRVVYGVIAAGYGVTALTYWRGGRVYERALRESSDDAASALTPRH